MEKLKRDQEAAAAKQKAAEAEGEDEVESMSLSNGETNDHINDINKGGTVETGRKK
jgi:hypothetical protein